MCRSIEHPVTLPIPKLVCIDDTWHDQTGRHDRHVFGMSLSAYSRPCLPIMLGYYSLRSGQTARQHRHENVRGLGHILNHPGITFEGCNFQRLQTKKTDRHEFVRPDRCAEMQYSDGRSVQIYM
jgi:hypothetical protein